VHQATLSRLAYRLALATGLCAGLITPAYAGQFDAGLAFSSDYVVYGITRSQGKPVAQAQLGWANESGWTLGAGFSTVDYNEGPSISRELSFYLARRWTLGKDLALLTELNQYTFNETPGQASYDYGEVRLALSFREWLEVSASVLPDYTAYSYSYSAAPRRETALSYGATAHFPANRWLSFNVGAGHFDLQRLFENSYTYWSAGSELSFGRVALALNYIGSDDTATSLFGSGSAGDRFVATLAMRFP
jgi:uncharacterized protein (TIGR02001 family)